VEYTDQRSGGGRNGTGALGRDGGVAGLEVHDDGLAVGVDRIRKGAIHIDDHAGHRRIGIVQADTDAVDTVGVEQKMFLFRV
jgi:hypothetical protein